MRDLVEKFNAEFTRICKSVMASGVYVPLSTLYTSPRTRMAMIGPAEHSAIRPKLSPDLEVSAAIEEIPTPIAMIKGTVRGPVVTPPASNATERKSGETSAASKKMMP